MTWKVVLFLFLGIAAATSTTAWAESSIYCGGHLVNVGDNMQRVQGLCGAPDSQHHSDVELSNDQYIVNSDGSASRVGKIKVIRTDRWYYSPRNGNLSRELKFEDEQLVSIEIGK
ncbi:MAG: DUF2845 domain-containing protein [Azospirillaceae bacterium]|nr:DUF2845 domain-containing protein [Azospirillaceae bacterium]